MYCASLKRTTKQQTSAFMDMNKEKNTTFPRIMDWIPFIFLCSLSALVICRSSVDFKKYSQSSQNTCVPPNGSINCTSELHLKKREKIRLEVCLKNSLFLSCRWPDGRPKDGHLVYNDWLHVPWLHRPHLQFHQHTWHGLHPQEEGQHHRLPVRSAGQTGKDRKT